MLMALWTLIWVSFLMSLFVSIMLFGPVIERKYFPVMKPGSIVVATRDSATQTSLWFKAEKVRDCLPWISTSWYLGKLNGKSAFVYTKHTAPPEIRDPGVLEWKRIIIGLPEESIRSNSFAITKHYCHPFWPSQSVFYIGNESSSIDTTMLEIM